MPHEASAGASVVLLTADLATSSKVAGAAARQNIPLEVAADLAALEIKSSAAPLRLVILDLSMPRLDPREVMARLRAFATPPAAIIAFGPHVHEALLDAARQAGCTQVLARGQFHARLDEILATAVGDD